MATTQFPLALVIKAVDQATGPLRAFTARLKAMNAPFVEMGKVFKDFGKESGLASLHEGFKNVGASVGRVKDAVFGLATQLGAMALGAGFALYRIVKGGVDAGASLEIMAQTVGLSVDQFAQLRFAAGQAGVSQEEFNGAIEKFSKALGQAKADSGPLLQFLEKVGPGFAEQIKNAHGVKDGINLMAKAFAKLDDPQKRAALSAAAFGKTGITIGNWLHQGSGALDEQMKRYFALAGSQEKFAEQSHEVEKALNETDAAFEGTKNAALLAFYPAVTQLSKALSDFIAKHRDGITKWANEAGAAITKWIDGGGIDRLIKGLGEAADMVSKVVDKLGGLKGVMITVAALMSVELVGAIVSLAANLVTLVPAIARVSFSLGTLAFAPVVAAIGNFIIAIQAGYAPMAAFNLVLAANPIGAVILGLTALAAAAIIVYKNWEPIKAFFESLWESMKSPIEALKTARDFYFGGADGPGTDSAKEFRAEMFGAERAAPVPPAASQSEAKVQMEFKNVPRGARVTQDKDNTADVDLTLGYAMSGIL